MSEVFIGIGSNKGNRQEYIDRALEHLRKDEDITIENISSVIETEPQGNPDQEKFLNAVIQITTFIDPYTIFRRLKNVERLLGRKESEEKWQPREIDLDILLYDDLIIKGKNLKIPHPLMHEREFVLEPLCEIAPDAVHPGLKQSARELLDKIKSPDESNQVAPQDKPDIPPGTQPE